MTPTSDRPALLQRLRDETRPAHDALEQNDFNQRLLAGTVSAADAARFLAKLYGFLQPYEAQLDHHVFAPEWEVGTRHRAHLILRDLTPPDGPAPALPLCPAMPPLGTWPQLLGAMYVVEGSTLGGQVITRQLAKAGIPLRAYFTGYAERTGPLWKDFCRLLTEAASETDQEEIVASARRTFQTLHTWINQP